MEATVFFELDEDGRRASLMAGGNGNVLQEMNGEVGLENLDLFKVREDGTLYLCLGRVMMHSQPRQVVSLKISESFSWGDNRYTIDEITTERFSKPFSTLDDAIQWERSRRTHLENLRKELEAECIRLRKALPEQKAKQERERNEQLRKEREEQAAERLARKEEERRREEERLLKLEPLKKWALQEGSQLLRARIEENMEWVSLARSEYIDKLLADASLPSGYEVSDDWYFERKQASLEEITTLRRIRTAIEGKAQVELVWLKADTGDDDEIWGEAQTAIKVDVLTPDQFSDDRIIPLKEVVLPL